MPRILLIHPNAAEAAERAGRIRHAGFECETYSGGGGNPFRALADNPPAGIVIDLARVPSQGGAMAVAFRQRKATRAVPLVMVEGDPEKTEKVRSLLPDAVFATWATIGAALRRAMRDPPERPIVPDTFAAYAGAPLARKLRIRKDLQ
jgi:hypothetical protein